MLKKIKFGLILVIPAVAVACTNFQSSFAGTSHSAGTDCLASGCHSGGEKTFTVAGTVYTDSTGTATAGGQNLTVTVGGLSMEVDMSGNFYSSSALNLPGTASVSSGAAMTAQVSNGSCNAGGCHDGMGQARIYQ